MSGRTKFSDVTRLATRRDVLSACAVCATVAAADPVLAAAPRLFQGCLLTPEGYRQYRSQSETVYSIADSLMARNRYWHTTGDPNIDHDLDRALQIAAELLSVTPAFGFYDPTKLQNPTGAEHYGMNAFASPEDTEIPGTKGTVGFGWELFHQEFYQYDNSGMTVMAIVGHEFGHILQQDRGLIASLRVGTPLKCEIHADFLAGYFLGMRKCEMPSLQFKRVGELFLRLGKPENGNPYRDHGDARERLNAAEAGFRVAYVEKRALSDAVRAGLEYVGR
jgi:hypothetical protein